MSLLADCVLVASLITAEARAHGVPPQLALAVAHSESRCVSSAVSSTGARGVFQVMPFWTRAFGGRLARHCGGTDLHQVAINICFGVFILRHYVQQCGDWPCALRWYSGNTPGYVRIIQRRMVQQRTEE